jgi:hypothetical protein
MGCAWGLAWLLLAAGTARAQATFQGQLLAPDGGAGDHFGYSVAVSADTAVVGAPRHDGEAGAAYVLTRTGGVWTQQAKLTAADRASGDLFGYSVAVSGDTVVVGAYGDASQSGSAYVFTRTNGAWTQQAKLTAADVAAGDSFGYSVAVSGDTVVVGAFRHNSENGAAYVFTRTSGVWTRQATLAGFDGVVSNFFGYSVAVSADTVVVGAYRDYYYAGSAYVFTRTNGVWTPQAKLNGADTADGDLFGYSVAVSGDTAVVGAYGDAWGNTGGPPGSAYVFARSGGVWTQQAKLIAADGILGDYFGHSVAVSGDTVVVGAYLHDELGQNSGSAYMFKRTGGVWTPRAELIAADGAADDYFGYSVAVSGDTAVVGAVIDDDRASDAGAAYVFTLDSDADGVENSADWCPATAPGAAVTTFGCTLEQLTGPQGPAGSNGLNGAAGEPGPPGPAGPAGQDGVSILSVQEPSGANCAAGGLKLTPIFVNGDVAGAAQYICDGLNGSDGAPGATGPQGPAGRQGPQGEPGATGATGAQGPAGVAGPVGLGLGFVVQPLTGGGAVTLPTGNASVIVLVSSASAPRRGDDDDDESRPGPNTTLTLPAPGDARSRFVLVRRMDNRGRLLVRPPSGTIVGGRPNETVVLERRFEQVLLVSDGTNWIIFDRNTAR